MADISKINAVLIANIAEIDDVLAANIAKVNGLVFSTAPAFTGLLDTYTGAAAAYSTRRLYGQYTGAALRVRRDSDDTEQDIGFDSNGDLDTSALATFVGSGNNGYVTKWYGQESSGGTGSGNDAAQTASTRQPQIYNGTAVITDNGKPALDTLTIGKFDVTQLNVVSAFYVARTTTLNYASYFLADASSGFTMPGSNSSAGEIIAYDGSAFFSSSGYVNDTDQHLVSAIATSSATIHVDGVSEATGSISSVSVDALFDGRTVTGINFEGKAQEIVLWTSDQSSNRSGIEGNVNAHFQIGNFGTPTSGLLYDYSGAAAAYSVRQLANTAALAMRIREDGTDTETDIGFDSNGDLDTAAIASHCGSNNGFVVRWFDQAGSQNDLTQGTSGNQPKIYNGTSVITSNGQPILDRDTNGIMTFPMNTQGYKMFSVFETNGNAIMVGQGSNYFLVSSSGSSTSPIYSSAFTVNAYRHNGSSATLPSTWGDAFTEYSSQNLSYWDVDMPSGTIQLGFASGANFAMYSMQELIMYPDTVTLNETGIETNINTYFSIY